MSTDKDVKTSYVDVFATTAAFIVGLGVLLFVVRSRRLSSREDKGRKVKYDSSGKPIT